MDTALQSDARWTLAGFRAGVMATLPLMPGVCAFAMAYGTVAARHGFSLLDASLMSATVYAGVAQVVVINDWPHMVTLSAIFAAAAVTALICSRYLLVGASMHAWLDGMPAPKAYPLLYFLTEPPWLLGTRYYRSGGRDHGFVLGSVVVTWIVWVAATVPGYWLSASVSDPQRFGLDMIMPAFFVAMLVSLWQGPRRGIGWAVAAAVAMATAQIFGGYWYVIIGAVAGSVTSAFTDA